MAVDETKLQELVGKMLGDAGPRWASAWSCWAISLACTRRSRLRDPLTPAELASRTGTAERYVSEWAAAQAAGGYINFDSATERFSISPEQALVLADENGPAFFPAMFEIAAAAARDLPKVEAAFRTGGGVGWHEHDPCLFRGTERFFRPGYAMHLVSEWIPALEGVEGKTRTRRARRGCRMRSRRIDHLAGQGISEVAVLQASTTTDRRSSEPASWRAKAESPTGSLSERASAKEFPGTYDLVAFFDCLHDMGDPVGAAAHVKST